MIIKAHLDKQDQLNAYLGAWRRIEWAIARVVTAFVLLSALSYSVARALVASATAFFNNASGRTDFAMSDQFSGALMDLPSVLAAIGGVMVTGILWFWFARAVKKLRPKAPPEGIVKDGLSTGKALIELSKDYLSIKTPLKTRKILWAAFEEIQETKTCFLFRYKNGDYEFLSKNALAKNENLEKLRDRIAARIEPPLTLFEEKGKETVTIEFEASARDFDEFRTWRRDGKHQKRPFLRRLTLSKPLMITGFYSCIVLAAAGYYGALLKQDFSLLMMGVSCSLMAASILLTNYHTVLQFAPHFHRDKDWPFNQTNHTKVTLTKSAVFRECRGVKEAFEWQAFDGVIERKKTAYLILTAYEAIAAPKRAFKDPQHYKLYLDFARARIAAAHRLTQNRQKMRIKKSAMREKAEKAAKAKRLKAMQASAKSAPKAIPKKSNQSAVAQLDGSRAAPVRTPSRQTRVGRIRQAAGTSGR